MGMTEFTGQLWRILDDYEARGREPQRVLEMIAYQMREFIKGNSVLAAPIAQMRIVVDTWERGERPDLDSLEIIAALARQL